MTKINLCRLKGSLGDSSLKKNETPLFLNNKEQYGYILIVLYQKYYNYFEKLQFSCPSKNLQLFIKIMIF